MFLLFISVALVEHFNDIWEGGPVVALLVETELDDFQDERNAFARDCDLAYVVAYWAYDLHSGETIVGYFLGDNFPEDHAIGVDIAALVVPFASQYFRGRPVRSAH